MLSDEDIAQLKAEHGPDLVAVESPSGTLVFKKPSRPIWADFIDSIARDRGSKEVAIRRLVLACAVQPKMADMDRVLEQYPALPAQVLNDLSDLAGTGNAFEVKKL